MAVGFFFAGGNASGWEEEWRDTAREVSRSKLMQNPLGHVLKLHLIPRTRGTEMLQARSQ